VKEIKIGDLVRQRNYADPRPQGKYAIGVVTRFSEKYGTYQVHWRSAELPTAFHLPSSLVVLDGEEVPVDKDIIVM